MNKEWSELNKRMQTQLKKKDTYSDGIITLMDLRNRLMEVVYSMKNELSRSDFDAMPFMNSDGYHSKNIAYSLWHIFRIEDITAHTLINDDEQVFFSGRYNDIIGSPIITTGNELVREQIAAFSEQLDLDALYAYVSEVRENTEQLIRNIPFESLKSRISTERKEKLMSLNVVSTDENAFWLIDYWCGKDIRGLIQMPFSRHWIMHIEACLRIRDKLIK